MKKIIYGLNRVESENIATAGVININYEGSLRITYVNSNFTLRKYKKRIKLIPKKKLLQMPKLLFTYKGYFKIINSKIDEDNLLISFPYDNHWSKFVSTWDTLDRKWSLYINSHKIVKSLTSTF
jgi:uncharacterized protein YktA (UPF0223 family)